MMTAIVTHCPLTVTLTPPAYITFLVRTTCSADVTGSETGGSANYTIVSLWTTTATPRVTPGRFCYYVDVVVVAGSRSSRNSTAVDPTYGDCILDYLDMPQVSPIHPCTGTSHDIMYCFV